MPLASATITLSHASPLAAGGSRWVFAHPDNPDLLIKVLKAQLTDKTPQNLRDRYLNLKSRYKIISHLREVKEYIRVATNPSDELACHLPAMTGLVNTDRGFGFVFEAIKGRDGNLAPTLWELISKGCVTEQHIGLMETLFDRLIHSPVIVGDFNYNNIVLAHDQAQGDIFMLVDGLGAATLIPTRTLVPGRNRRKKEQARDQYLGAMKASIACPGEDATCS